MRTQRLACAKNKVFCYPNGTQAKPGELLSEDSIEEIGEKRIKQLIAKGRVVVLDMDRPAIEKPASVDEQRVQSGQVIPSKWQEDPTELQEATLDELNLLILDIDPDAESAPNVEAARAKLCADYIPGQ